MLHGARCRSAYQSPSPGSTHAQSASSSVSGREAHPGTQLPLDGFAYQWSMPAEKLLKNGVKVFVNLTWSEGWVSSEIPKYQRSNSRCRFQATSFTALSS